MARVRVGDFTFDPATGELTRGEEVERLPPHAAQAFALLVDGAGELVPRETLRSELWPRGFTDADVGLNVCIRQIRVALGDDAEAPRYVETLRGRGYRLVAEVVPADTSQPIDSAGAWRPGGRGKGAALGLAGVLVLALMASIATRGGDRLAVVPFREGPPADSIVPQGRALAELVISSLAQEDPDRLAVVARTSSFALADEGSDPLAVGRRLDADYVLEGSLDRAAGLTRLTVQLLDVGTGTYAWSQQFEIHSPELLGLNERVATGVLAALSVQPQGGLAGTTSEADPQVRDELLRARYLISQGTTQDAVRASGILDRALVLDSAWAPTWVERARALLLLDEVEPALEALAEARRIDADVLGLDRTEGAVALYGQGDALRASVLFARAVNREPGSADLRRLYAQALAAVGRARDATRQGRQALELDPVSATVRGDIGWVFYYARAFELARESCRSALELVPESVNGRACIILAAQAMGALAEEHDVIGEFMMMLGATPSEAATIRASVSSGNATPLWSWLLARQASIPLDEVGQARVLSLLDRPDDVVATLSRAVIENRQELVLALQDPLFDRAHDSPVFQRAARSAGLFP